MSEKIPLCLSAVTPLISQDKLFHATGVLKHCRTPQKRLCVKKLSMSTVVQDGKSALQDQHLSPKVSGWDDESLLYPHQLNETSWHLTLLFPISLWKTECMSPPKIYKAIKCSFTPCPQQPMEKCLDQRDISKTIMKFIVAVAVKLLC